ncbi:MAG TPA: alpha/beta hydrolase [Acidimicrobiia bacterium]|jgi:pimeloyl-ACP methyl ester carboxylesterase
MTATIVLVHGAWHGAWCWDRLTPLLDDAGVTSIAVDLPGHGNDPGPFTDLHGDADRVCTVLDGVDGDVVLVGHSYGGCVITDAGVHPDVRHLVYIAAFPLDADESAANAAAEMATAEGVAFRKPGLPDAMEIGDDGTCTLATGGAAAYLYNTCDAETQAWAAQQLCPQPMSTLTQEPRAVAWRERPSTYVLCEQDLGVPAGLQGILARRCTNTITLPTDHSPFAGRPELVAPILVDLARA